MPTQHASVAQTCLVAQSWCVLTAGGCSKLDIRQSSYCQAPRPRATATATDWLPTWTAGTPHPAAPPHRCLPISGRYGGGPLCPSTATSVRVCLHAYVGYVRAFARAWERTFALHARAGSGLVCVCVQGACTVRERADDASGADGRATTASVTWAGRAACSTCRATQQPRKMYHRHRHHEAAAQASSVQASK